jgi:hydroxypyruvate reductase
LPDQSSFEAGARLLEFVRRHENILFLISGGGSACVEAPLEPWFTRDDIVQTHRRLLDAGLPIEKMNIVRKQLSAIKGGRLAALVRGRSETLLYSDVGTGDSASVASGPTVPDTSTRADAIRVLVGVGGCDHIVTKLRDESLPAAVSTIENTSWAVVADNSTLVRTAADLLGARAVVVDRQIESDVEEAADFLSAEVAKLAPGQVLVAGGEPTVVMRGSGKGGRCLELAVRFAGKSAAKALFGSSDGVDGNSGVAGAIVDRAAADQRRVTEALQRSDALSVIDLIGRPIIIPPTGNNLRDLYLMARS